MKKIFINSKESDSKEKNLKKDIESYNMGASKKDMKNSLSSKEIYNIDKDLIKEIPKESKKAQELYSKSSDIFNEYFRGYEEKTLKEMAKANLKIEDVKNHITNLKKSTVTTKKEYVVYRGVTGKFDVNRFNKSDGFISTSFDKAIAKGYTRGNGEIVVIRVLKGTPVMYIRQNSIYPLHMELLMPDDFYLKKLASKGKNEYVVTKRKLKNSQF